MSSCFFVGAIINVSDDLYSLLWRYVRGAREYLLEHAPVGRSTDRLFINKFGGSFENSANHCLKSFCKKTEVLSTPKRKKFCNTNLRKNTVTNTRQKERNERSGLATLMAHSLSTADTHYDLPDKLDKASAGHDTIRNLFATPTKKRPTFTALESEGEKDLVQNDVPEDNSNDQAEFKEDNDKPSDNSDHQTESRRDDQEGGDAANTTERDETDPYVFTDEFGEIPSVVSTNTIPPSPLPKKRLVSMSRKSWSSIDEETIMDEAFNLVCGIEAATKGNIYNTIDRSQRLTAVASREGRDRLFEKIKSMKKTRKSNNDLKKRKSN